jgi:glycine cleavage system aminomethyltransferase T
MTDSAVKRSSFHHLQAHARAQFARRHGWEIVASYGDVEAEKAAAREKAALADVSWLGKIECKGPWVPGLAERTVDGAHFYRLTGVHGIWIVRPDAVDAAARALEGFRAGQARSYLVEASAGWASVELLGPKAPDVLSKVSSARVAVDSHGQHPVGGVHAVLIRRADGYQIHFAREYGEYLWESLIDAGEEFGLRLAGADALEQAGRPAPVAART